jgi:hypothetical protein
MSHHLPAGSLVRKQIHVQHRPAAAGAYHGGLLLKSVFLDNVKGTSLEALGESILHNLGSIRGYEPGVEALIGSTR